MNKEHTLKQLVILSGKGGTGKNHIERGFDAPHVCLGD